MRDVSSYRMRRVNEAIKEIIGTAITQDLKDPRIGFVTLTGVDTAPDLSHAKVFVSVYGKQTEKDASLEGLTAARTFLQHLISDELNLKRTPVLEFMYDGTVDRGMRIQAILKSSGAEGLRPEDEDTSLDEEEELGEVAKEKLGDAEGGSPGMGGDKT